ncbi:PP2C family protein-serine/threonine phosphatase [Streptomyces sp. NPDC048639]|uniref:PP2C family protein-serine/threonine phosphatase n=1 Tax=Streptomyces sp. NPDC048639 TaxID=3365581 RepID=UPI0037219C14
MGRSQQVGTHVEGPRRLGGARRPSARVIRWIPALLIIGGAIFDLMTPPRFTGSPFFSAAPLVAAPFFSLGVTALTGGASVLTVLALRLYDIRLTDIESVTELVTVFTVAVLALLINRVVRRGDLRLASARTIAEAAQRAVLPDPAERIGGFHVAARYEAAHAEASIGGDLYAVQDTPYGVRLVVGDVRGKGLDAVEAVAILIGSFREAAEQEPTLEAVARRLEWALHRESARGAGPDLFEGFTTVVLAEVHGVDDPAGAGTLRLLNRGHPPPLLLYEDGGLRGVEPKVPALPLGMDDLGVWPDLVQELAFPGGATLLLFTDGVTEARNARGVFYDPVERLRGMHFPDPGTLLDALVADVRRHAAGEAPDDMALLAVARPEGHGP